ncbi:MAG: sugar kinase [Clostridia bacterium]|nr:sugar kinase [Clostridia bacterium]
MKKSIVAFGEIMLRLTPPDQNTIANADSLSVFYGGSESNVLISMSSMGDKTRFISAVPENDIGASVIQHLHRYGVDSSLVKRTGETLGMYFLEEGFGKRPSKVIYFRKHAEITRLTKNDFDYDEVFFDCALFHISGISFALSESVLELCFTMLEEAKKRNIKISFDFNYRSKLWSEGEAKKVYKNIIPYADIVFCSHKDLETFLDVTVQSYNKKYPDTEYLIVREREILASGLHKVKSDIYRGALEKASLQEQSFVVLERIGGGDAFAAGVLHALLKNPDNLKDALRFGTACFILKHTIKGDVLPLGEEEIHTYLNHLSKDVTR